MKPMIFRVAYCFFVVCCILDLRSNSVFAIMVITGEATDITSNSATLQGEAYGRKMTAWFEYGTASQSYGNTTSSVGGEGPGMTVSIGVSGLSAVTTYYYRLVMEDSIPEQSQEYGSEKSFTTLSVTTTPTIMPSVTPTLPNPIEMTTGEATNVTSNSATLNGSGNGRGLTMVWFEYGIVSRSYDSSSLTQNVSGSPFDIPVSISITGLSSSTTYYYRIAGQNSAGTISYGNEKFFTTLSATVTPVTTLTPECEPVSMKVSPKRLILQREQNSEVIVTLEGDNCVPEGKTVTATIGKIGNKRITISSASEVTDENGQTRFTITAKNKGNARVIFKIGNLKQTLIVKVR